MKVHAKLDATPTEFHYQAILADIPTAHPQHQDVSVVCVTYSLAALSTIDGLCS